METVITIVVRAALVLAAFAFAACVIALASYGMMCAVDAFKEYDNKEEGKKVEDEEQ